MTHRKIARIDRAAQHRNGGGALPYISVFFTDVDEVRLHALVFAEPGRVAVFSLDDPTQRVCGGRYEPELRAAIAEIGLPFDMGDPIEALHERAEGLLLVVRQRRSAVEPGPDKARLRAIGRHLDTAKHALARAMERANA